MLGDGTSVASSQRLSGYYSAILKEVFVIPPVHYLLYHVQALNVIY